MAALDALGEALDRSGLRLAESPRQATVRVELTGQRMLGGGRGAFPSRFLGGREIALIRATVSRGDELREVRGPSATSNRPWRSAATEAVRAIEQWLADQKATRSHALFDGVGEEAPPSRALTVDPELLSRIREYVGATSSPLRPIVAEERYRQEYWQRRLPYPSPIHVTRREQRSEMGFTFFANAGIWFGFRDVLEVDGAPVPRRARSTAHDVVCRRRAHRDDGVGENARGLRTTWSVSTSTSKRWQPTPTSGASRRRRESCPDSWRGRKSRVSS
jgi:hypothetical protein